MKPLISTTWRLSVAIFLLAGLVTPGGTLNAASTVAARPAAAIFPQASAVIVEGIIDASYGPPVAIDPSGDGNGKSIMDLLELYVTEDAGNFYFAFTISGCS